MVWWKRLIGGKSRHESYEDALIYRGTREYQTKYETNTSGNGETGLSVLNELTFLHSDVPKDSSDELPVPPETTTEPTKRIATSERVRLNVGGQIHEFSRDILQRYPDSMLDCMMERRWQQTTNTTAPNSTHEEQQDDNDDIPFIDRNGQRFGYVLDLYRDGVVHLPVTVSSAALLMDLEYFGLDIPSGIADSSCIRVSSIAEATEIAAALDEDMETQLNMMDQSISEKEDEIAKLKRQKAGVQIADAIFKRFCQSKDRKKGQSLKIYFSNSSLYGSRAQVLNELAKKAYQDKAFLTERLKNAYGIKLIEIKTKIDGCFNTNYSFQVCDEA